MSGEPQKSKAKNHQNEPLGRKRKVAYSSGHGSVRRDYHEKVFLFNGGWFVFGIYCGGGFFSRLKKKPAPHQGRGGGGGVMEEWGVWGARARVNWEGHAKRRVSRFWGGEVSNSQTKTHPEGISAIPGKKKNVSRRPPGGEALPEWEKKDKGADFSRNSSKNWGGGRKEWKTNAEPGGGDSQAFPKTPGGEKKK